MATTQPIVGGSYRNRRGVSAITVRFTEEAAREFVEQTSLKGLAAEVQRAVKAGLDVLPPASEAEAVAS